MMQTRPLLLSWVTEGQTEGSLHTKGHRRNGEASSTMSFPNCLSSTRLWSVGMVGFQQDGSAAPSSGTLPRCHPLYLGLSRPHCSSALSPPSTPLLILGLRLYKLHFPESLDSWFRLGRVCQESWAGDWKEKHNLRSMAGWVLPFCPPGTSLTSPGSRELHPGHTLPRVREAGPWDPSIQPGGPL